MKCEVLFNTVLAVEKGSIVEVSERQFELARKVLKPIKEEKPKEEIQNESPLEDAPKKERRKKK